MNEEPKRLPIDLETLPFRDLKATTGDQCWFAAIVLELRELNRKLDEALATMKEPK
jgi:hypothetical protein